MFCDISTYLFPGSLLPKKIKTIIKLKIGIKTLERLKRTSRGMGCYQFRLDSLTIKFIKHKSERL